MKIGIYGIQFNPGKLTIFQNLFNFLNEKNGSLDVIIYEPFRRQLIANLSGIENFGSFTTPEEVTDCNFVFCLGGDGSILDSVSIVRDSGVPVLGINTGRLGFLSSISSEDVVEPLTQILEGKFKLDTRSILKLTTQSGHFANVNFALNEVTVHKKDSSSMMIIHTYVDGDYLNSYWADGLIISTPTGSTGYNLACSGPIIMPGSDVFILTPIAPHNLNVRPLIIPENKKITLKLEGRDDEFLVALDSRSESIKSSEELTIERGEYHFKIARSEDHSFFTTLRNKLSWGLDKRN